MTDVRPGGVLPGELRTGRAPGRRRAVARAAARAVLRAAGLLAGSAVVVSAATALLPADAVAVRAGGRADPAALAQMRAAAGLDQPWPVRFLSWAGGLLTGDPGRSLVSGRPVADLVTARAGTTAVLVVAALVVAVPLAALLARRRGAVAAVGSAVPPVVVAVGLATLLSGVLHWVPPVSLLPPGEPAWTRPDLLVLPVLALALPSAAFAAGQLRGVVEDVAARPFVRDAVLRGVPGPVVALRYAGPFVAAPALRVLAVTAGSLFAGSTVVETLFGVAGLGELLVGAVATRDLPVVSAVALLAAAVVVAGMLVADLVAAAVDRR